MNALDWRPGDLVQWSPDGKATYDYGTPVTGVVSDAPNWPPVTTGLGALADGDRIPVDLDPPLTIPASKSTRPFTMTRLWVRAQFLEPRQEATDEPAVGEAVR